MTIPAVTVSMTPNWYDQYGTYHLVQCPLCYQYYAPSSVPHTCYATGFNYQPPMSDPFAEFKKLYRAAVLNELYDIIEDTIDEDFKEVVEMSIRRRIQERIYQLFEGAKSREPTP